MAYRFRSSQTRGAGSVCCSMPPLSTVVAVNFQRKLRADRQPIKWLALATFVIWACIIILGRLIAYDHVWGSWSPATKA